jgi:hypothetical protein
VRTIKIEDLNAVLPQTLLITCRTNEQDWDVSCIEIYADSACEVLLADDILIRELPRASQLAIYKALNDADAKERQRVGS